MSNELQRSIAAIRTGQETLYRFITANDVGSTNAHQAGFYISPKAATFLFDRKGQKGQNMERIVKIAWPGGRVMENKFSYYGRGTRNECRITRFGRDFLYFSDKYVGSLLVLVRNDPENYSAFILDVEEDIDGFYEYFNLPLTATWGILLGSEVEENSVQRCLEAVLTKFSSMPSTDEMAQSARDCVCSSGFKTDSVDSLLLRWIDVEYRLFKLFEEKIYRADYSAPFASCQALIDFANKILNRRKSRAGKSLELHLAAIFREQEIPFQAQPIIDIEGYKRPDFLFPSAEAYKDASFPTSEITFLAAKTTCKDRWRQILQEADRLPVKYLFTLQPCVSERQFEEMEKAEVRLVIPKDNFKNFSGKIRPRLLSLADFCAMLKR
jgi:Restriction endonuclease EcoRII, N-terminal./EcoRII C terminal.